MHKFLFDTPTKYNIVLRPNLTSEQKLDAYKIMEYILVEYNPNHCVDRAIVNKLLLKKYLDSYEQINVMY
jgi:hypothetical protein